MSSIINRLRKCFIWMTAKNEAKKSYSYKEYLEEDGYDIVEKITAIYWSKSLQIFNWMVKWL